MSRRPLMRGRCCGAGQVDWNDAAALRAELERLDDLAAAAAAEQATIRQHLAALESSPNREGQE